MKWPWRLAAALLVTSCGGPPPIAKAPDYEPGLAKCDVVSSQREPLIVEWPAAQRAKLEALSKRGLVAVRYQGCDMEVIPDCHVERGYGYTATTPQVERVAIRNEDELYARLPLGAARLEGDLKAAGQLEVSMTIVGTYRTDDAAVTRNELVGRCDRATHVVAGFTVGAFRFSAGASNEVGGGVNVAGVGAGARSREEEQLLRRAGDERECGLADGDDSEPPFGCGALLRVEVATVGAAKAVVAAPPETMPPETMPPETMPPETMPEVGGEPPAIVGPATTEPPGPLSPEPEPLASTPPEPEPIRSTPDQRVVPASSWAPAPADEGKTVALWVALGVGSALVAGAVVVGIVVAANEEEEAPYIPEEGGLGSGAVVYSPVIEW